MSPDRASRPCPECGDDSSSDSVSRRSFLAATGAAAAVAATSNLWFPATARAADVKTQIDTKPETLVKTLYDTLKENQKKDLCFDWDYMHPQRGLLRTRISNNWHITDPVISTDYFTTDQRALVRKIYEGLIAPEWLERIDKHLKDDVKGGWGNEQNIAIFGKPGDGKFELVMTGRHMTYRVDGNSTPHMAFGGPIFYGHAASGFNEKPGHPDNVFWPQALAAHEVFKMLDGKQREKALVENMPEESAAGFKGKEGKFDGIKVADLSSDQKERVQKTLQVLLEPYRQGDREEVGACLKAQGGLDACNIAFYKEGNLAGDDVWDVWRLEGPAFVWHFRGTPHVHVWVNIADDPSPKLNA